jgi:predicted Zn finger-like uncharacterized protein
MQQQQDGRSETRRIMRIQCPNCETSYQLADGALGSVGRKVRCARCGTVWHASPAEIEAEPLPEASRPASPEPSDDEWREALVGSDVASQPAAAKQVADVMAEATPEPGLPALSAPDPAAAAPAVDEPPPERLIEVAPAGFDAGTRGDKTEGRRPRRRGASAVRALDSRLSRPRAIALMVAGLVLLLAAGLVGRTQVVRAFPDFAGLYRLIGLEVNLRGMEFDDIASHREMDGSTPVLIVEGSIRNLETELLKLPPVRITLKSSTGRDIYAWNYVLPQASVDASGTVRFKTRLLAPPEAATMAEVRFTDQRGP